MGQKVHPIGYRIGVIRDWESKWYAVGKNYVKNLHEDIKLRSWIKKRWEGAGISRVEIERDRQTGRRVDEGERRASGSDWHSGNAERSGNQKSRR